ncbi:MAG: hypothetical protein PHQ66_00670 [Candidatus Nanoarchaeia archaeon]|nr:hypothetical protein [Candidatus Nanoarchaeia archaeon]MDD5358509.1 hypothetical protein [Candidatus Nanoarchaeia archaeon]MDD5589023.1 hypothetical protein [Candidatus Nanoarchaeia archaeon]
MEKRGKKKVFSFYNFFKKNFNLGKKSHHFSSEKGLSTIIMTMILILVSLAAIGILWVVINNLLKGSSENVGLERLTLSAEIKEVSIDNSSNNVSLLIRRNVGGGNLVGMKFFFYNDTSTEVITQYIALEQLKEENFLFHLMMNVSNLNKISIVPVFSSVSGKENVGTVADTFDINTGTRILVPPTGCTPMNCSLSGYNCGTHANGTCAGTLNCGNCSDGYNCIDGVCHPTSSLCSDLKLLYHLDRNTTAGENDSYVRDWSGEGNNAITNAIFNSTGKIDGAYELRSSQDIRSSPNKIYPLNQFAVSLWIKCTYPQPAYPKLFMAYRDLTSYSGVYIYLYPSNGTISYIYTSFLNSTGTIPTGLMNQVRTLTPFCNDSSPWRNVIYQYDGAQAQLYVDSVLIDYYNIISDVTNVTSFRMGNNFFASSFNGTIDEVAFWNRSLNSSDITALNNLGSSGQELLC